MKEQGSANHSKLEGKEYQGMYGTYTITSNDKAEVLYYRIAVLICGVSLCALTTQWFLLGPKSAWIWIIPMEISLGLSLRWIHIYLRPLHKALQIFWALGCLGTAILIFYFRSNFLLEITQTPGLIILIGPIFVALTGLGFKEFFCFRRMEAIGMTILVPIALLGYLSNILRGEYSFSLLWISSILLLIMAIRKFTMAESADIGDKSVFEFLSTQRQST